MSISKFFFNKDGEPRFGRLIIVNVAGFLLAVGVIAVAAKWVLAN